MHRICHFTYRSTTRYWYHPDHLGSASWVSDKAGKGIQHLYYLPWGEELDNQRATDYASRYTFSGKERDEETGYGYFGVRYYNSDLSIWLSVDPMANKYPSLSPYTYCADNPVKLVDPDGRDIWKINEEGRIVSHNATYKKEDIFYRVDNNGKEVGSVSFGPGTIEKQKSISYSPDGKKIDTYDVYQVRGDENGTKLFKFLAQTVSDAKIEVAHFQCGMEGDKGLNFITCAHEKPYRDIRNGESCIISTDRSLWYLFSGQLKYGYTIRAINHSHPDETTASPADISCKLRISKYLKKNGRTIPKFNIYHVPTDEYFTY